MARRRILVVEDDAAIRLGIVDALQMAGYETLEAARGDSGRELAIQQEFDLLLLDLVLPRGSGLDILRAVRQARPTLPVIIITARGMETDRLAGFRCGADDYVVKPFSVKELLARVVADLARCEVRFDDGERVELSDRERELLRYLAANAGRAIERDEILSRVWHVDPHGIETRTIDMHVARLRQKLRDDSDDPRVIVTVRGKGYKLGWPEASG
jgi:two-component system alkaline phosphatase synthesis response regulator PhoP